MMYDNKNMADSTAAPGALAFYLQEHATLRTEIENDKQHLRKLETYAVVATGAIWSWLWAHGEQGLELAWFIPIFLGVFGFLQTKGIVADIKARAAYLRELEGAVSRSGDLAGWENFLHLRRGKNDPSVVDWVFWGVFVVFAVVGPFIVFRHR